MAQGTVKWFNPDKGYGFIALDDGTPDVFGHYSVIDAGGYLSLDENRTPSTRGPKGPQGTRCTLADEGCAGRPTCVWACPCLPPDSRHAQIRSHETGRLLATFFGPAKERCARRRRILRAMSTYRPAPRHPLPNSPFNVPGPAAPPAESYAVSDQVTHDKHGLGTIIGVEEGVSVLVDFRSHKQRLSMPCAKLTKL